MALRKIMTEKEPVLHKKCRPVTEFNSRLHQLLDDMRDTLRKQTARAAAPQVGVLRRVVVVDTGEEMLELDNRKSWSSLANRTAPRAPQRTWQMGAGETAQLGKASGPGPVWQLV